MKPLVVILVLVHVLLHGAAVPHAHAGMPCHADRPHVHLSGHPHRHADARRDHEDAHDQASDPEICGSPLDERSPAQDDCVIYLDDEPMLMSGERTAPTRAGAVGLAAPAAGVGIATPVIERRCHRVRPPGDGTPAIHSLLPHVLRV